MNGVTTATPLTVTPLPWDNCLDLRHPKSCRHRFHGQTTVEFALICLPFFAILFAIIDYAQIYFYENSLQNAMREAARFATAGSYIELTHADGSIVYETNLGVVVPKAIPSAYGAGEASRNECIRYWFLTNCVIQLPLSNIVITSIPTLEGAEPLTTTNATSGKLTLSPCVAGPGGAGDYIEISANYTITTITPLFGYLGGYSRQGWNQYPVIVSAIVKNETGMLNFLHTNIYTSEPGYFPGTNYP
jgi:Flp pilus assembly protein TadG